MSEGAKKGIVGPAGLIAQGRGEAFDYLLGERTTHAADMATRVAAALLLLAERPVLSVNGNTAALVPEEMVELAQIIEAPLEVNLFYRTEDRVRQIVDLLQSLGAETVYGDHPDAQIPGIDHQRARACKGGIYDADVVLVPLEDGDRCEALVNMGKVVITIDLNPLSRTARTANVTIVDNVVRVFPSLISKVGELEGLTRDALEEIAGDFDNIENLRESLHEILIYLQEQFSSE